MRRGEMRAGRSAKKRFPFIVVFVAFLMVVFGNANLFAVETLTLEQAVKMGLERSPEMQESQEDILVAKSQLDQANAGRWAQADVNAVVGPSEDAKTPIVVPGPEGAVGHLQDRDENGVGIFGRLDFFIVQPLYTFGKISNRQHAASFGVEAQRAAKEKKRAEVILTVKKLYYALVVAQQGKDSAEDAGRFVKDARHRIQRLIQLHSTNVQDTDIYRLDAFETQIAQFKAKAESGYQVAYQALKRTLGYPPNEDFALSMKELPKGEHTLQPQDEYVRLALAQRPELQQLNKGVEARKSLVEAAKADLYPSIYLAGVGSLAGAPNREKLNISYFPDDFNHAYGGVVLGANWHFDFGIGTGKVHEAKAKYNKLLYTKAYAERNIPIEVIKDYQDIIESKKSYEAFERGAKGARKWIVASMGDFDMGVGTAKDMMEAIDRYGKNQGDYLVSLYDYNVGLAKLSYATGENSTGAD
jgi:outer membrane protein